MALNDKFYFKVLLGSTGLFFVLFMGYRLGMAGTPLWEETLGRLLLNVVGYGVISLVMGCAVAGMVESIRRGR